MTQNLGGAIGSNVRAKGISSLRKKLPPAPARYVILELRTITSRLRLPSTGLTVPLCKRPRVLDPMGCEETTVERLVEIALNPMRSLGHSTTQCLPQQPFYELLAQEETAQRCMMSLWSDRAAFTKTGQRRSSLCLARDHCKGRKSK